MSDRAVRHRYLVLAVAAVLVASMVGCGSDDDEPAGGGAGSSTTTTAEGGEEPSDGKPGDGEAVDPYDGHTSEIYDGTENWICHADLDDDVCHDLDVTTISADGTMKVEEREAAADPPIDCFYVYPTVSSDPGPNSDLKVTPDDNEVLTVIAQAAQFAQACRVFAPVYRQIPLVAIGGGGGRPGAAVAYGDVLDAWKTYVSQWNEGRGVILIGHSQGTGHLRALIENEIDDEAEVRKRLVAAYLFGGTVQVPDGELVGGSFDEIPACASADEVGCVVTWSSYPLSAPPVENAIFGRSEGEGQRALCVNALDLLERDRGNPVAPIKAPLIGGAGPIERVDTTFIALPDAVTLSCESTEGYDYLGVAIADEENDERPLDRLVNQTFGPTWGLHLLDMTVALDDLVELAQLQGEAFEG